MLDTLLKIGKWQSEGMSQWDRILNKPNVKWNNKKGEPLKSYTIGLVFDLDEWDIYIDLGLLKEYDKAKDPEEFKAIQIQGGNNKSIYVAVEPTKLKQLFKTFFGKLKNEDAKSGELVETIDKNFPQLQDTKFYKLLQNIFPLRDIFIEKATKEEKIKFKNILDSVDLGRNENIILVYAAVKSEEVGFPEPLPIAHLDDYESFLSKKFLERNIKTTKMKDRLCYASGEFKDDVTGLDLSARYSLNKMFVTETKNYASLFDKKSFPLNYQVSLEYQEQLDLASEYLLSNYKTAIADVDHVIIPQFIHEENLDIGLMLNKLKAKSDLLFSFQALDELSKDIGIEADEIYWINFLAFESDGNYFKTLELIKDVSNFHFQDVIKTFNEIDWEFKKLSNIVNWEAAKKNYGKIGKFNLNTVYGLIPIRKDKEKKNIALQLFKTILEQRKIEREQLFQFFSELMLCHYYERYESYTNVRQYGKDYFGLAIRDNVFKYLAFIQVLKKLNLIDMEQERKTVPAKEGVNNFDQKIDAFFKRMDFNDRQKAMFFLGRMLNAVAYLQKEKKKTVIDKINYNGMDRDDIVRLRVDLFEKAKQYGKSEKVKFTDSHFGQYFNFERWIMNPQEAVFFILTGYSFGIVKQQNSNSKND